MSPGDMPLERLFAECFVPNVVLVASTECDSLYENHEEYTSQPLFATNGQAIRVQIPSQLIAQSEPLEVESLIKKISAETAPGSFEFQQSVVREMVSETTVGKRAQPFETWGHPLACVLVVSSKNNSPISALTQMYQQSFSGLPRILSGDAIRCVLYVDYNGKSGTVNGGEDFDTVQAQFGPYCYRIDGPSELVSGLRTIIGECVYPFLHNLMKAWHMTGASKRSNTFGLGKFLKKLVNSGPPKPENNLFADVCHDMQPHVASIPAKHPELDIDMQLRRLADVAFMLGDMKNSNSAYVALKKTFSTEQRWANLGAASEMAAITGALLKHNPNDVTQSVDSALYTYNSRIHSNAHALRCALFTALCLIQSSEQLRAADLLTSILMDVNPILGSNEDPAESAMLMEEISLAYEKLGWKRKMRLWKHLASVEWKNIATETVKAAP